MDKKKNIIKNGYFVKLIGMEGECSCRLTPFATSKASCGNSVTPETTGSGHARGKRPGMEINF
ncbi:hypothetical protein CBM15_10210 [Solibacillus kalamii]|uniref:Bacteriocin n=1 Tax=Solibacillus kalamii TaxID=1748298 RepID=A0ABX3ZGN4_9BACL|nr:hypothetical protein CBM15_10210 [Solibacillus kalamii]